MSSRFLHSVVFTYCYFASLTLFRWFNQQAQNNALAMSVKPLCWQN